MKARAHFCEEHAKQSLLCAVHGCTNQANAGQVTCSRAAHRRWQERQNGGQKSATCTLRARLDRAGVAQVPQAGTLSSNTQMQGSSSGVDHRSEGLDEAERSLKGISCRRWTHNEQLIVRCCGIIVSRAPFYNAEGVSGVAVSHNNSTGESESPNL